ncbi:MAG: Arginyl-tRNA--protein transferase 1 [Icmadophila ericetorum]|nr:Arginyl-tRNA--protein transferase 1 [Icmadophila ericetorum]
MPIRLLDYVRKQRSGLDPEKKHRRNHFDIAEAINQFQYCNVKKPVDPATKDHIEPAHKFEIILEPDTFTEEKYALFEQYQRTVHKEPPSKISRSGFKSFLCSGLGQDTIIRDGKELKVGSYHQCYRIDGHLIGLGVLDLLPHAVSSVYLIYDQSVNDYNFGKISALQEINFAAEAGYGFYYMDPEAYYWDLLSPHVLALLSSRLYLSLSRERRLGLINQSFDVDHALSNEPVPLTDPQERTTKSEISKDDLEYINGQGRLLTDYRKSSIFDLSVPGVMAAEEVSGLPQFAEWTIKSGDFIARLSDLADWDTTEVTDPFSIKGIAAELAACIGSEVIKESVIEWHH